MAAKKTKSTRKKAQTKKRKTTRSSKKRASSLRSKKKLAPKKKISNKKKVSAKKTLRKTKKKLVRKIEALITRETKPAMSADDVHSRYASPLLVRKKQTLSKRTLADLAKFSFPSALSQVRDSVHQSSDISAPLPPKPKKTVAAAHVKKDLSPYILDLKNSLTVTSSHRRSPLLAKKSKDVQESFHLFDEKATNPLSSLSRAVKRIGSGIAPGKAINLVPPKPVYNSSWSFARIKRRFSYHFSEFTHFCTKPYRIWYDHKLQKAFQLPDYANSAKKILPLVKMTRAGQAIPVSRLDRTLKKAKDVISISKFDIVNLSELVRRKSRRRISLQPFIEHISLSRALVPFITLVIILIVPFAGASFYQDYDRVRTEVQSATNAAVMQLQEAGLQAQSFEFLQASEQFDQASQSFLAASALIENEYGITAKILSFVPIIGEKVRSAEGLLEVGNQLSEAATIISQGVAVFTDEEHFLADQPASYKLEYLFVRLQEASPYLQEAVVLLEGIEVSQLPEDIQSDVLILKQTLPVMSKRLEDISKLSDPLLTFLGHDTLQRYLMVFQNNTELRATGGFMGSIALVDLDRAEIQNIEIPGGGPYDFQGSLFDYYQAPRALQLINPRWELQDANWFFNWPTSAAKISNFYEKSGGPSIDGVIAINTNVLEALLAFVGPVTLEEYDLTVDAENFRNILQNYVEFEYDEELNQPKKVIADLAPILLEKLKQLEANQYLELASYLSELLAQRDILLHHTNSSVFDSFSALGWTGEVLQTDSDYLAIVHTNLAGGKTDSVIQDSYDLDIHIGEDGETNHTLTIRRQHNGVKGVPLLGVRNVDYLRVYVPQGAELLSATGFEAPPSSLFESPESDWIIDPDLEKSEKTYRVHQGSDTEIYLESGKTVFANWVQVDPGHTAEIKLTYRVPNIVTTFLVPEQENSWLDWFTGSTAHVPESVHAYRLYWQKQSGAWSPNLSITINYPQHWEIQSSSDLIATTSIGSWNAQAVMKGDSVWSYILY